MSEEELLLLSERSEELRRKSCVIAMPILAKDRLVRSQARKVRSISALASSSVSLTNLVSYDYRSVDVQGAVETYPTPNGP